VAESGPTVHQVPDVLNVPEPGGHLDFDDYTWSLAASQTMSPRVLPMTAELHTQEQIEAQQVALVVDLLVRRDGRYEEVVADKAYRKVAS